jgi:hypothetical protein
VAVSGTLAAHARRHHGSARSGGTEPKRVAPREFA